MSSPVARIAQSMLQKSQEGNTTLDICRNRGGKHEMLAQILNGGQGCPAPPPGYRREHVCFQLVL